MRPVSQRFFKHSCIYLWILIISYLATFLGTNSLSVLMCLKSVNESYLVSDIQYPVSGRIRSPNIRYPVKTACDTSLVNKSDPLSMSRIRKRSKRVVRLCWQGFCETTIPLVTNPNYNKAIISCITAIIPISTIPNTVCGLLLILFGIISDSRICSVYF